MLTRENCNNIYVQEPVSSRVVEFYVVLTSVTNLHDYFGLYSFTDSMTIYDEHCKDDRVLDFGS